VYTPLILLLPNDGALEAEMAGDYAGLLKLAATSCGGQLNLVAGAGFEPDKAPDNPPNTTKCRSQKPK